MLDGMALRYKGGRQTCLLLEVAMRALRKKRMKANEVALRTATAAGQICCELNKLWVSDATVLSTGAKLRWYRDDWA